MPDLAQDLSVTWERCPAEKHQRDAVWPFPCAYEDEYEKRIRYTVPAICTPSEIVRNDVIFLSAGEMDRTWAERVYVGLAVDHGDPEVQGFVHVRPKETLDALKGFADSIPELIESYLSCPPRLRPSTGKGHVIEDDLAAYLYGDPYVTCDVTPYCRPHRLFAGVCAQAAAHMCLVLCSKRHGGQALGTFDIHRLASAGEGPFRRRTFGIRGLTGPDIASVFHSSRAGLDAVYDIRAVRDFFVGPLDVWQKQLYSRDAIGRALLGLIDSDCPVILAVDFDAWVKNAHRHLRPDRILPEPTGGRKHGIVVVGYRWEDSGSLTLIIHDSGTRAFVTGELHAVLEAAEAYNPGRTGEVPGRVHLVAAVPKGVRVGPIKAGLAAWEHTQRPGASWEERDRFLRGICYRLIAVSKMADAIGEVLGLSGERLWPAKEVQALLEDEGVAYLWRMLSPGLPGAAVFADATYPVLPAALGARLEQPQRRGVLLTADPVRGIGLACPDGQGSDWWHFPRELTS